MAIKFQISRKSLAVRFLMNPWGRAFLLAFTISSTFGVGVFTYYYVKYARIIEDKLKNGPSANTSILYASPRPVMLGDQTQPGEIADYLRRAGYSEASTNRLGWYHVRPGAIEINPGPDAYDPEGAVVKIEANRVTEIISLRDHTDRTQYNLEPELITNLFDQRREKRRLVHFADIPKVMVNAVLSAEDKHFFQHAGFDPVGILRAVFRRFERAARFARGVHAHPATRAHLVAGAGTRLAAQDSGNADHAASGAAAHQEPDF